MVIDEPTAQRSIAACMHFLGSLLTPQETKGLAMQVALLPMSARGVCHGLITDPVWLGPATGTAISKATRPCARRAVSAWGQSEGGGL